MNSKIHTPCPTPRAAAAKMPGWAAYPAVLALALSMFAAGAQTVTLTPNAPRNYWAGENTSNSFPSRTIAVALGGGATNINLALSGTNGTTIFGSLTPNNFTNNGNSILAVAVTNAVKGQYPLTVNASGDAAASTNFNLFVVPQWVQTNVNSSGNWSDNTKWSGGAAPLSTENAYIEHVTVGPWTNVVDSSRTVQSLVYLGDADDNSTGAVSLNTTIAAGQTLSVLGTNGFFVGRRTGASARPVYTFNGGTLLVSNSAAAFALQDANPNATRFGRVRMDGLDNLYIDVDRVAVGDATLNSHGPQGQSLVDFYLAKTNFIRATFTDDYNALAFSTAITYNRQTISVNNGQGNNAQFRLGTTNVFHADSIGIGLGNANGSGSTPFANTIGYRMVFANASSTSPTSGAVFRNADGSSPMSLLAIGVDQGLNNPVSDNRGIMDLRGGTVDMLVNQIWLGQNRTNQPSSNFRDAVGGLYFDWGNITCDTLIAGNMKFTNTHDGVYGYVIVGTNGTLVVKGSLSLGLTPSDVTGFETFAELVGGQLRVDNGGAIVANQINVGQHSTNNFIIVNGGGRLEVSNTLASSAAPLDSLTVNSGGTLALHKNGANTRVYVKRLVASGGIIDIASVTGAGSFAPLISYSDAAGESASFIAGNVPPGFNATLFNNTATHTIDLTLTAGTPKTLLWKGYVNGQWDNSTTNWLDLSTGYPTNFSTGDSVIFDDTAAFYTINVTEDVVPRQAAGIDGMIMTNNSNPYIFTGSGGIRGAASFVKYGTNSVAIDNYSEIAVTVGQGSLTGSGTIGLATVASGAACSWSVGGVVLGKVSSAGSLTNAGTINNGVTLTGGTAVNLGTMNGALNLQTDSYLYNAPGATLSGIGSPTIATNATLVNQGIISGQNLNVTGVLIDSGMGSIKLSAGTLTINGGGTFYPGGASIGTTFVTENSLADPLSAGAVRFLGGSTSIFKVDYTNTQTSTKVLANRHAFGPSQSSKAFNGGTIVITNVGNTPFAAGQSFKLFGSVSPLDGNIVDLGANTTNSYPVMDPVTPGPGLVWDLSSLIPTGVISIKAVPTVPTNLVNVPLVTTLTTTNSTNNVVIFDLSWPADYIGWRLETQITALTNGIRPGSSNWTTIFSSVWTNQVIITNSVSAADAVFFRMSYP